MLKVSNCNVIDIETGEVKYNKDIIIEKNYISRIENHSDKGVDYKTIDAKNKYIIPGLIDSHVHLTMYATPDNMKNFLIDSAAYTTCKAYDNALKCLKSGFTTIRTMGDKSEVDIGIKQAINEGILIGPRILCSGKALTMTGGHGDLYPGDIMLDSIGEVCDGIEEVRKVTRKRLKYNCDNIKLMATGGGNSAGPGTVSQFNEDEMRAAVEEANKRGKITSAHCIGTDGIKNALRAGVRTIEHGTFLDDEAIQLFLEKGAYLVPTLCAFRTIKYGAEGGVPDYVLDKINYFATEHYSNLKKAIKSGVKIICGTDTGTPFNFHGEGAEEIYLYTENGLSNLEALQTATSLAAEALKLDDLGYIREGYLGDLLIIDGNPLENLRLLMDKTKIIEIIKDGNPILNNY